MDETDQSANREGKANERALMEGTAQFIPWKLRRRREIAGEREKSGREGKSQEHEAQDGGDSECLPAYGGGNRANKATAFRVVHGDGDRESYSPTARHASTVDTRANPVDALLP
ncbi:hypothetical protein NOF04DRAFT_1412745 [Fusarium oxysporum II5]|nr:hypothetical protein NOF04DRAFT_1412745 [Fusarium oxysporum II5]